MVFGVVTMKDRNQTKWLGRQSTRHVIVSKHDDLLLLSSSTTKIHCICRRHDWLSKYIDTLILMDYIYRMSTSASRIMALLRLAYPASRSYSLSSQTTHNRLTYYAL